MIYLSLGSNIGDRKNLINSAFHSIKKFAKIEKISSIYESIPLGFESDELFYNCCIGIESNLSPFEMLTEINKIEANLGRVRVNDGKYHSRNIDIDILFFDEQIIQETHLIIPHPRISERNFVLIPLVEIAADFIHPESHESIIQILSNCKDNSKLTKIQD
jgi:2-amino-4-hydroxy-6-hydroxymethyldihydropteridine diphosphokinase